jgi:hypothetical protein
MLPQKGQHLILQPPGAENDVHLCLVKLILENLGLNLVFYFHGAKVLCF